ncbi:hypothetical protein PENTCL1PPCAC_16824, partial [Pristionchus entomophagus]
MTYYETFNVLAFHFVYRFRVIVQGKFQELTANWKLGHWLTIAIIFTICHTTLLLWGISFSSLTNEYSLSLDPTMYIDLYGVNTSDPTVGYVVIEFRRLNEATGLENYHYGTLLTFAICIGMFGVSATMMVVCSAFIIEALQSIKVSTAKKNQQRMLFRALLIQSLIPCIFSYIPLCIIWLFPLMTGVALGALGNLLTMTSTVFPSVDAIIIIWFIPAYKNAVKMWILNKIRPLDLVIVSSYSMS